jgi:hypothetical protein
MKRAAVVLCSFRHKVPAGQVIDSDDKHDDRDEHDLDDLPNLEDIIQPAVIQPHDIFFLSTITTPPPPPPPPPQPPTQPPSLQTVTLEEVFGNFRSVLNLQLIPDDERNTEADATAR